MAVGVTQSGVQRSRGPIELDAVMMFKALIQQTLYGLSDAQTEFQILDRRSFGHFLGLDDGDNTPDGTTIGRFREALVQAKAIEALFAPSASTPMPPAQDPHQ